MKNKLRWLGFIEGGSLLALLFIAMPLKYMAGMPEYVRAVGMIHGILFIIYVMWAAIVASEKKWTFKKLLFAWVVSVVPFGPFIFDKKIYSDS